MSELEKMKKLVSESFKKAADILKTPREQGGELAFSFYDNEAFRYKEKEVLLIFYFHKISPGEYEIKVRSQGTIDKDRGAELLYRLACHDNGFAFRVGELFFYHKLDFLKQVKAIKGYWACQKIGE